MDGILKKFHRQLCPLIYRAFGSLRAKLGRIANGPPDYPTFADTCFFYEESPGKR